jgi:non-ribosomal peptide synthetase component F
MTRPRNPAERHQLLLEWNDTKANNHNLRAPAIRNTARNTPDAVAAVFENQRLSYREPKANRVAIIYGRG